MSTYLLDTDVLINASKNRDPDRSWILQRLRGGDTLGTCAITLAEFYAGARRGTGPRFEAFLDALPCFELTPLMAIAGGTYRHDFARKGVTLATTDVLIAAIAHHRGAILVTHNVKDFPMTDIDVSEPVV